MDRRYEIMGSRNMYKDWMGLVRTLLKWDRKENRAV